MIPGRSPSIPTSLAVDLIDVREDIRTTQALREAAARDVNGKRLTPWLLAAVTEILGSRTLAANQALLLNNARVAASIATTLCELSSASTSLKGH